MDSIHMARLDAFMKVLDVKLPGMVLFKRYGVYPGQPVFWNVRDEKYGQRGFVVEDSNYFSNDGIVVRWKEGEYHTELRCLRWDAPKRKRARKEGKHADQFEEADASARKEHDEEEEDEEAHNAAA
eukprot:5420590-Karenia_brevis.AAC.1